MTPDEELADWAESVRDAEAAAKHNAKGRDKAIRKAIEQGVTVPRIVKATGLTRGRIYQIRDAK